MTEKAITGVLPGSTVIRMNSHKRWENGQRGRVLSFDASMDKVKVHWYIDRNGKKITRVGWVSFPNLEFI